MDSEADSPPLFVPNLTSMVGIYPFDCFMSFSSFIDLFCDFNSSGHIASICIGLTIEIPPMEVGLVGPYIMEGVKQNIGDLRLVHIIALVRPMEQWWVVVDLSEYFRKYLERDRSGFLHGTANCGLLC